MIGALSNGKDVRRHLIPPLSAVNSNCSHGVNWEPLVGVDSDTEKARIGVDQPLNIALLQVEQDRSVIKISQVGHVFTTVILGRIHLRTNWNYFYENYKCDILPA